MAYVHFWSDFSPGSGANAVELGAFLIRLFLNFLTKGYNLHWAWAPFHDKISVGLRGALRRKGCSFGSISYKTFPRQRPKVIALVLVLVLVRLFFWEAIALKLDSHFLSSLSPTKGQNLAFISGSTLLQIGNQ